MKYEFYLTKNHSPIIFKDSKKVQAYARKNKISGVTAYIYVYFLGVKVQTIEMH